MWQNELRQSAARLVGRASKEEWGLDFWFDKASCLTIKRDFWIFVSDTLFFNSTNLSTNIETARSGEMAGGPGKEREVGMVETSSLLITAVKTLEMLPIGQQPFF